MSHPLDRWDASIKEGKAAEAAAAVCLYKHCGFFCEDNTKTDATAPDLRASALIDLKFVRSPYPSAPTPAGLQRDEHLTLDFANIDGAQSDVMLLFAVDYTAANVPLKGLYYTTVGHVQQLVKEYPKRVYMRSNRTRKDKSKKIGISVKECAPFSFPGMSVEESYDEFMATKQHPLLGLVETS